MFICFVNFVIGHKALKQTVIVGLGTMEGYNDDDISSVRQLSKMFWMFETSPETTNPSTCDSLEISITELSTVILCVK